MNEISELVRVYHDLVDAISGNKVLPKTIVFNRRTGERLQARGPFIVRVDRYNLYLMITVTDECVHILETREGKVLAIRVFDRGFCPAFVNGQVGVAY